MKQSQILLVAQNSLVRYGLKNVLNTETFSIAREEASLEDAIAFLKTSAEPIDLIVYDQNEIQRDDSQYFSAIFEEFPRIALAVLTSGATTNGLQAAVNGGACAFLPNSISPKALNLVLHLLLAGENLVTMSSSMAGALTSAPKALPQNVREPRNPLSPREAEIVQLLKAGAPNKVIARELNVAEATVKIHVKSVLRKIEVSNRTQVAIWAMGGSSSSSPELT